MLRTLIILLIALIFLTSCGASMVVPAGGGSYAAYAPLNEPSRAGIIRYLNAGVISIREARREDAYRQMYAQCAGRYTILEEGPRNEGGSSMYWGYGITTWQSNLTMSH